MTTVVKRVVFSGNFLMLAVLLLGASFVSEYFWTSENILNVVRSASLIGIVAIGMNVVIISGGIDLSVGSAVALVGAVAATYWVNDAPWGLFVIVPILVALAVGLANGLLVTVIGMQPFVATLILMTVARGAGLVYTNGQPVYADFPDAFLFLARGSIFGIPTPAVFFIATTLVTWYLLKWRVVGRATYVIGANETAAFLSGIRVLRVKLATYLYCSFLAGFTGLVLTARMGSGEPGQAGMFWELDAIAAVVIGGTALEGGRGSVWGAFVGALIIGIVANLFNLLGIRPEWQLVSKGLIILAAVGVQALNERATLMRLLSRSTPSNRGVAS